MPKKKKPVVKVCTGSRCTELKGKKLAKRLAEEIAKAGAADIVRVKKCDCVGNCKRGPIIVLPQGQRRFEAVKPKEVGNIVHEILEKLE